MNVEEGKGQKARLEALKANFARDVESTRNCSFSASPMTDEATRQEHKRAKEEKEEDGRG